MMKHMEPTLFDELQTAFQSHGPTVAIERLCERLRERKEYTSLFYALLMKKRHELGVSPIPTGSASDLPPETHEPFEQAIRTSSRQVGQLFLDDGNIPQAWVYFRMIHEPAPVVEALEKKQPAEGEELDPLIQIAFYENVHPQRGFEWVLTRYGICSAITTLSNHELPQTEVRRHCIGRLVRALYRELKDRLGGEIERREGSVPNVESVRELMAGRDWLFAEDFAHIDTSHLSAVVQMSTQLEPGPELDLTREMCSYGKRISPRLQYPGEPPFENQYEDYGVYLDILAGVNVEEGVAHFRAKAEQSQPEEGETQPAEVLVNLLLRLNRPKDAVAVGRKYLAGSGHRRLSCPGLPELCERAGDYQTLAELARDQNDPVHFVAGLIAARRT
jgi:hypothetical protein